MPRLRTPPEPPQPPPPESPKRPADEPEPAEEDPPPPPLPRPIAVDRDARTADALDEESPFGDLASEGPAWFVITIRCYRLQPATGGGI